MPDFPRPGTAGPERGRPADGPRLARPRRLRQPPPRLERHGLRRPGRLPRGGRPARRAAGARPERAGRTRPQQRGPRPEHHRLRLPRRPGAGPGSRSSSRTCARTPNGSRRWRSSSCRRPATRPATWSPPPGPPTSSSSAATASARSPGAWAPSPTRYCSTPAAPWRWSPGGGRRPGSSLTLTRPRPPPPPSRESRPAAPS